MSTSHKERVDENEIMVSFDAESLFTNVPIEGAVRATLCELESDLSFPNHTTLTAAQIADLLNFAFRSTYFQYDGATCEQQDSAAMGSPVSAVSTWRTLKNRHYHPCKPHQRSGNVTLMTLLPS